MEQNKSKPAMPQKQKSEVGTGPRTTVRPEIDLPLKGGRSDSGLAPKTPGQATPESPARPDKSLR